jgi:hypothetical protein
MRAARGWLAGGAAAKGETAKAEEERLAVPGLRFAGGAGAAGAPKKSVCSSGGMGWAGWIDLSGSSLVGLLAKTRGVI